MLTHIILFRFRSAEGFEKWSKFISRHLEIQNLPNMILLYNELNNLGRLVLQLIIISSSCLYQRLQLRLIMTYFDAVVGALKLNAGSGDSNSIFSN